MTTYTFSQLPLNMKAYAKALENKKLGCPVSIMPAKIHGCFQSNWIRVKISLSDNVIGQTCNEEDYSKKEDDVKAWCKNSGHDYEYSY